jgi:hypothetical protein
MLRFIGVFAIYERSKGYKVAVPEGRIPLDPRYNGLKTSLFKFDEVLPAAQCSTDHSRLLKNLQVLGDGPWRYVMICAQLVYSIWPIQKPF